jgi:hypothetical protein
MKRHPILFIVSGLWLSLLAILVGGSLLLPPAQTANDSSLALLYKFASRDRILPVSTLPEVLGRSAVADLDTMNLALYEGGVLVKSYPILSKGKPGTPWETPTGRYRIQQKEVEHYSTIGGTWMPYSMQFYGNYFVHGWPTYASGDPVPVGYSGGCIRLSTLDAKEVYEFLPRSATLAIIGGEEIEQFATSSRYYLRGVAHPPTISAQAFLVADLETGQVLWEYGRDKHLNPGGLSVLVAGLSALETVNQYQIVRMSEVLLGEAVVRKHRIGAVDEVQLGTLMYPLLFDTNDTAASVFASVHGERQFVTYMNEKAQAIGMEDTAFSGATSLDPATTTVRDLFVLASYIKQAKRFMLDVTLAEEKELKQEGEVFRWENRNPWVKRQDAEFRGGVVRADVRGGGSALVLFSLPLSEFGSRTLAFIVVDAPQVVSDVDVLRTFIQESFVYGQERTGGDFIRETGEPTIDLFYKVERLLEIDKSLKSHIPVEAV